MSPMSRLLFRVEPSRRGGGDPERVDIRATIASTTDRLREAEHFLGLDLLQKRRVELEASASLPDLWDDPDNARSVTTELGRVTEDIELLDNLSGMLSDALTLYELSEEEGDQSQRPEVEAGLADLDRRLGDLELRSLFAGDHDELDAGAEIHAGAGGTDAQDWAEMQIGRAH